MNKRVETGDKTARQGMRVIQQGPCRGSSEVHCTRRERGNGTQPRLALETGAATRLPTSRSPGDLLYYTATNGFRGGFVLSDHGNKPGQVLTETKGRGTQPVLDTAQDPKSSVESGCARPSRQRLLLPNGKELLRIFGRGGQYL